MTVLRLTHRSERCADTRSSTRRDAFSVHRQGPLRTAGAPSLGEAKVVPRVRPNRLSICGRVVRRMGTGTKDPNRNSHPNGGTTMKFLALVKSSEKYRAE